MHTALHPMSTPQLFIRLCIHGAEPLEHQTVPATAELKPLYRAVRFAVELSKPEDC